MYLWQTGLGFMRVVRWFEMTDIRIVSISIVDSPDFAIIRLVLSNPKRATEIFAQANLPFTESDLLIVKLPNDPQPLLLICKALLEAEVNIHYAYPLLIDPSGNSALALYVEDHETATLEKKGFGSRRINTTSKFNRRPCSLFRI